MACIVQPSALLCQNDSAKQSPKEGAVLPNGPGGVVAPRVIYPPDPTYDEASRKAKIEGKVRVRIVVAPDGQVKHPQVLKSLSEALDKRAIEAVSRWKFEPATKDGQPVAVMMDVELSFHFSK